MGRGMFAGARRRTIASPELIRASIDLLHVDVDPIEAQVPDGYHVSITTSAGRRHRGWVSREVQLYPGEADMVLHGPEGVVLKRRVRVGRPGDIGPAVAAAGLKVIAAAAEHARKTAPVRAADAELHAFDLRPYGDQLPDGYSLTVSNSEPLPTRGRQYARCPMRVAELGEIALVLTHPDWRKKYVWVSARTAEEARKKMTSAAQKLVDLVRRASSPSAR